MWGWLGCFGLSPRGGGAAPPPPPPPPPPRATRPPFAPEQSSGGSAGSLCPRRRSRRPWPPRCAPTPHAVAGDRAAQPNHSRNAPHEHGVKRARAARFSLSVAWVGTIFRRNNRHHLVHPKGPSRQLRCHAVPYITGCVARRAARLRAHAARRTHARSLRVRGWPVSPGFAVWTSRSGWAGRGSRGQPAAARGGARELCTARRGTRPGTHAALHGYF